MYQLMANGYIKRLADGAVIPNVRGNRDFETYLQWIDAGNTPLPAA